MTRNLVEALAGIAPAQQQSTAAANRLKQTPPSRKFTLLLASPVGSSCHTAVLQRHILRRAGPHVWWALEVACQPARQSCWRAWRQPPLLRRLPRPQPLQLPAAGRQRWRLVAGRQRWRLVAPMRVE